MNRVKPALMSLFGPILLLPHLAIAQIDLDHPIRISPTDEVYLSKADPGVAYAFPKSLMRLNEPRILREGDRLIATFDVGVDPSETLRLQNATRISGYFNLEVRYLRPLAINLISGSATNLPEGFEPELTAIGDPANFTGPVTYRLVVDRAKRFLSPSQGLRLLSIVFGSSGMDHIGTLEYDFGAVALGAPFQGHSQVPLLVGERKGNH